MKITIITSLFAKWDMDIDSGYDSEFELTDAVLVLFHKAVPS